MFCFKCGSEIPEESEFCMKCGIRLPKNEISDFTYDTTIENNVALYAPDELYRMFGNKKIDAIKYVAHDSGMSLKDAKDLVDTAYKNLTNISVTTKSAPSIKEKPLSKHQRIKENKKNAVACCPKCGSTSLSANKKGFGIGKAVVGSAIIGPIGLVAGNKGAKKVRITCLNCGHQWKP